jgi:hypothetical protein
MTTSTDRGLLAELDGHNVLAGRASRNGLTLLTRQRRSWPGRLGGQRAQEPGERRPGSRLIATGAILLFLLGLGLLAVSFAAQYQYVLHERHQYIASLIEAGALDVGLIIFSLLALGLARAGLSAKIERAAVIGCAIGSAVMNYAAADVTSPRSVLAYCMPPVFLAFVVDRVVRTIQRHVLGMDEARSPWSVLADTAGRITRFWLLSVLYGLRFVIDHRGTWTGVRQAIVNATPLPAAAVVPPGLRCQVKLEHYGAPCGSPLPCPFHPEGRAVRAEAPRSMPRQQSARASSDDGLTKTERLLTLVVLRHGDLIGIPLDEVSKIATACAPEIGMHPASARSALLAAVRRAIATGGSDSK